MLPLSTEHHGTWNGDPRDRSLRPEDSKTQVRKGGTQWSKEMDIAIREQQHTTTILQYITIYYIDLHRVCSVHTAFHVIRQGRSSQIILLVMDVDFGCSIVYIMLHCCIIVAYVPLLEQMLQLHFQTRQRIFKNIFWAKGWIVVNLCTALYGCALLCRSL